VCVDASGWGSYSSGIFANPNMSTSNPQCSHAVALVGYGTSDEIPYWIVRNSWNTWWGESGYIKLDARRHANGNVYGALMPSFAYYPVIY